MTISTMALSGFALIATVLFFLPKDFPNPFACAGGTSPAGQAEPHAVARRRCRRGGQAGRARGRPRRRRWWWWWRRRRGGRRGGCGCARRGRRHERRHRRGPTPSSSTRRPCHTWSNSWGTTATGMPAVRAAERVPSAPDTTAAAHLSTAAATGANSNAPGTSHTDTRLGRRRPAAVAGTPAALGRPPSSRAQVRRWRPTRCRGIRARADRLRQRTQRHAHRPAGSPGRAIQRSPHDATRRSRQAGSRKSAGSRAPPCAPRPSTTRARHREAVPLASGGTGSSRGHASLRPIPKRMRAKLPGSPPTRNRGSARGSAATMPRSAAASGTAARRPPGCRDAARREQ